jgi:hypothetical protein
MVSDSLCFGLLLLALALPAVFRAADGTNHFPPQSFVSPFQGGDDLLVTG